MQTSPCSSPFGGGYLGHARANHSAFIIIARWAPWPWASPAAVTATITAASFARGRCTRVDALRVNYTQQWFAGRAPAALPVVA